MSTTKEQRIKEQEVTISSQQQQQQVQQREHQQAINKALDETKDNIRRTTDEARRDIPRYTQIVNEYQEETIQAARQMADNYLESQREIINSLQSALVPQIEAANKAVTSNWTSPRHITDSYARLVSALQTIHLQIFPNLDSL